MYSATIVFPNGKTEDRRFEDFDALMAYEVMCLDAGFKFVDTTEYPEYEDPLDGIEASFDAPWN